MSEPRTRCPVCGTDLDREGDSLDGVDPAAELECRGGPRAGWSAAHWRGTKDELIGDDDDYAWCL